MPSSVPGVLDALAARLGAISGIVAVYRALEGAPFPEPSDGDLPSLYIRLVDDKVEATQDHKAKTAIRVAVELFFVPDDAMPIDNQAAAWNWAIRRALNIGAPGTLHPAIRLNPGAGIELQGATYHYPSQPGDIASVRQPLILRLIETY